MTRALDLVRELLLGPERFTELRAGLPQVSLSACESSRGVVRCRKLPPPAASRVYEQLVKNDALA